METVQVQLPMPLAQRVRQASRSGEALNRVVAEALEQWLDHEHEEKADREQILKTLREAGLIMSSERQRAFAETMLNALPFRPAPNRERVEAALAKFQVPLSEEIIAMRGER